MTGGFMHRRRFLGLLAAGSALPALPVQALAEMPGAPGGTSYPEVVPGRPFAFPLDHGAHPDFRTEWWYVTGRLDVPGGETLGFQVTFFRNRPPPGADTSGSGFSPDQILFAHAGLSDSRVGAIRTAERGARAGFGLAEARVGDADVVIDDWFFRRRPDGRFETRVSGSDFTLTLELEPTTPPLLQGDGGYSRKGPRPENASYYYSLPQLRVAGRVTSAARGTAPVEVTGVAWLDREWSSDLLGSGIVGWDWTGLNFEDGGALTAFRLRDSSGGSVWAGGSYRWPDGRVQVLTPDSVAITPRRIWRSPRSGSPYPIDPSITVRLATGPLELPLTPLLDDQEIASGIGLPTYWEGLVSGPGCVGYLELVGYGTAAEF